MTLLIAGGSGFLGTALAKAFRAAGHRVMILTRRPQREGSRRVNRGQRPAFVRRRASEYS